MPEQESMSLMEVNHKPPYGFRNYDPHPSDEIRVVEECTDDSGFKSLTNLNADPSAWKRMGEFKGRENMKLAHALCARIRDAGRHNGALGRPVVRVRVLGGPVEIITQRLSYKVKVRK